MYFDYSFYFPWFDSNKSKWKFIIQEKRFFNKKLNFGIKFSIK